MDRPDGMILTCAQYLGEGAYLVKNRGVVRFLQMAAVH
jgi:hypothetical protein